MYIQPGTNRSVAAADIKQDVHLLWEKTEAWLPSLAQRLPTMVNWQGRPPPPQGCEALVLFCPNQFAEHRKLIPHPQSNSFLSIPLHAVPGSTSCPRAASQQGLGLWGSGEGGKPLSNRASFYFNRMRSEQRSEKANKNPSFPTPSPQH